MPPPSVDRVITGRLVHLLLLRCLAGRQGGSNFRALEVFSIFYHYMLRRMLTGKVLLLHGAVSTVLTFLTRGFSQSQGMN